MKQRIIDTGIILFVTVMLLALLEVGARWHQKSKIGKWKGTDISERYRIMTSTAPMKRRHHFLIDGPNENSEVHAVGKEAQINSLGYRSPERTLEKGPNEYRILCAGGSTTFDLVVTNNDSTWPAQLEHFFSDTIPGITVWNAGFPGWSSIENIISLAIRDIDLQPDLIVLFQGINDLRPLTHAPFDRQYEKGHGELRDYNADVKPLRFYHRSVFLENLNRIFYGVDQFAFSTAPGDFHLQAIDRIPDEAINAYLRNLTTLKGIADVNNVKLVIISQILRIRESQAQFDRDYIAGWVPALSPEHAVTELNRLNDITGTYASGRDITFLDARTEIDWIDADFADVMHFTDAGSRKFAEYLHRTLLDRELILQNQIGY